MFSAASSIVYQGPLFTLGFTWLVPIFLTQFSKVGGLLQLRHVWQHPSWNLPTHTETTQRQYRPLGLTMVSNLRWHNVPRPRDSGFLGNAEFSILPTACRCIKPLTIIPPVHLTQAHTQGITVISQQAPANLTDILLPKLPGRLLVSFTLFNYFVCFR